jgi:hypothetical protein
VIEKDEQDILEEEKLYKIFLKNICSEIMEEVMDLGSDLDVILPRVQVKSLNTGGERNLINLRDHKMRGVFWNCNWFKDPKKHRFISDLSREQNLSFIAVSQTVRRAFMTMSYEIYVGVRILFGISKNLG